MATPKAKTAKKKSSTAKKSTAKKTTTKAVKTTSKPKNTVDAVAAKTTKKEKAAVKEEKAVETKAAVVSKPAASKGFFARKFDASENILTIFKDTKILGALIGEIFGTAIVTMICLTLGLFNPLYYIFAYVGVTLAVFALSGANLNPVITAGMLATRRMSAIRGTLYILAQIVGAWVGYLVVNAFFNAGIASGNIDATMGAMPALTAIAELEATNEGFSFFWPITLIEFMGAVIIAFFYARALVHKRSPFSFAFMVGAGVFTALLFAVIITNNFFYMQDNVFVLNPAVSFMYGLFPSNAEGFDALMSALLPQLVTYVVFPVLGGIAGFYLSDAASKLSGHELAN